MNEIFNAVEEECGAAVFRRARLEYALAGRTWTDTSNPLATVYRRERGLADYARRSCIRYVCYALGIFASLCLTFLMVCVGANKTTDIAQYLNTNASAPTTDAVP